MQRMAEGDSTDTGKPAEGKGSEGEPGKGTEGEPGKGDGAEGEGAEDERLRNERKRRESTQKELDALRKENEDFKKAAMTEQERAVAEAKAAGRTEALHEVAGEMLKAEVRAQAAAKLADPADAVRLLDLDELLGDDGRYDAKAIGGALDDLVKAKPYLAKPNGSAPAHRAPQGARDGGKAAEGDDFIRTLARGMRQSGG